MSTTIKGYAYHSDFDDYGSITAYRDSVGVEEEPSEVTCTLVLHEAAHEPLFTETQVKAMLEYVKGSIHYRYRPFVDRIAAKHGIALS